MPTPETPQDRTPDTPGPYDAEMKAAGQLTSPTWELELFLSGAFVFATFQLPGLVERLFQALEPHTTQTMSLVVFTGSLYAKAIAFTLIVMFLVHLIARAYWVALMGLHSVFPRGILWPEMKVGPVTRDVYQSYMPDMSRVIAKLDNFCSVIFSVGLLITFIFVYSTILGMLVGGISYLLALAFTNGQNMRYFFIALMSVFVIIPVTGALVDKKMGDRIASGTRAHRTLRRAIQVAFAMNLTHMTGPMMWTLATNVGRTKSILFMYVAIVGLILVATADRLVQSDRLSINSYDFFGSSRTREVWYRYYESQRETGRAYPRTPSIQSDIIRDPYVKLFIPYYARRHNAAIAKECPGIKPIQERGLQVGANLYLADSLVVPVLACIARIHAVTLDGTPRPDLEFSFYEHPTSGLKGVITYIPVDSLPRGRHVIGVLPAPPIQLPTDTAALRAAEWKKPAQIPFWR